LNLLHEYLDNLTILIELVSKCKNADLDRTIINSPTIKWITYSLKDALEFLFEHEHRHLNQAIEVLKNDTFPKKS
jgi:DinB superfamily